MTQGEIAFKGSKRIVYIDQKFNNQTVISKSYKKYYNKKYLNFVKVKCNCGSIDERIIFELFDPKRCKTCSNCCVRLNGAEDINISGEFFAALKGNARTRGIEVSITKEDIYKQYLKQNSKCNLTGLDIFFRKNRFDREQGTASIDRIDSSKGYTSDNIQILHKDVNKMKMDFNQEYFIRICKLITKNNEYT